MQAPHEATCRPPPPLGGYRRREPEHTVLHQVLRSELETFLARQHDRGRPVPRFVERELHGFLECGILARGFVRVHCDACGKDRLVAFSCKGRGFCPSCGGRRMADTAAWLVDRVLPLVPVRQWVLTLPFPLRFRLAYDSGLTSDVLRIFLRAVFSSLRRRARRVGPIDRPQGGAVTFVQRFGDALNLNVHFHALVLDGVYEDRGHGAFHPAPPPDRPELERVLRRVARRLDKLLDWRDQEPSLLADDQPLLAGLADASIRGRVATGQRSGRGVQRLGDRIDPEDMQDDASQTTCVAGGGFSLHAGVVVPPRDRTRLEHLCRYVARPPVATERLCRLPDGRLLYRLKRRWRDGTTHMIFEPAELLEKLVSLVPPPRSHQVRYHGVLAPCAGWRAHVVPLPPAEPPGLPPGPGAPATPSDVLSNPQRADNTAFTAAGMSRSRHESPAEPARARRSGPPGNPRRLPWAELMRRVFALDVLECPPPCGGRLRILAAIHDRDVARAILDCLESAVPAASPLPARTDTAEDLFA